MINSFFQLLRGHTQRHTHTDVQALAHRVMTQKLK